MIAGRKQVRAPGRANFLRRTLVLTAVLGAGLAAAQLPAAQA